MHVFAAAVAIAVSGAWAIQLHRQPSSASSPDLPRATEGTFVGSGACVACHPAEHASFGRTYHRTMTQEATDASVLAPLPRRDGVPMLDGRRVVLTTGSHRQQTYWTEGDKRGDLRIADVVWLVREKRLIPRAEAFVTPPGEPLPRVRWGSSCIQCHAVAGEPRHDVGRDSFDLRAAELGIACEACHGPGAAHADRHRDPFVRYAQRRKGEKKERDPTIVHPNKIGKNESIAVCGQCHAYAFPRDVDDFWSHGYARAFRAGDTLDASRTLLTPGGDVKVSRPEEAIFWADGTVRVGGRETNGFLLSACTTRGEATCLSCHAMHAGDPSGQLAPKKTGDAMCTQCHASTPEHSHHAESSPGRACVACHMPKTSYALLGAVRSHRIDVPSAENTATSGRPNACNLCHLDRSLAWTDTKLALWYGKKQHDFTDDIPEGARGALSGDAATRAIYAAAFGARDANAPPPFREQVMAELGRDPYPAVRWIANLNRTGIPATIDLGPLAPETVRALLAARDDRKVSIAE